MIKWNSPEFWELFSNDVVKFEWEGANWICGYDKEGNAIVDTRHILIEGINHQIIFRPKPKPEPKIGQWGKGFENEVSYTWGVLESIRQSDFQNKLVYVVRGVGWSNFQAGLPEGFDKEGNPI